jgi:hypothetical protein
VKKPILVVASQFAKEIEDRFDLDYLPRRNPNTVPFSRERENVEHPAQLGADKCWRASGQRLKRFRGGGSSRASISVGARCLFSGTALAGFRLKPLDRCPVRIL